MRMRPALVYSHSRKEASNDMTTPASAKQLAAKLRAIEKANPGMKYRALFLSTIGDVAALESDGQVDALKALAEFCYEMARHEGEEMVCYPMGTERAYRLGRQREFQAVKDRIDKALDAAASEGS